jgi:hypothetical protein
VKKPRVFIASATQSLDVAYAIQAGLEYDAQVVVWSQGTFDNPRYALEALTEQLKKSHFGVFVFTPDDRTHIGESLFPTVRDNVLFELGMFIGHLGRERCFLVTPRDAMLHIPTDLLGLTPLTYDVSLFADNSSAALGTACHAIRNSVRQSPVNTPTSVAKLITRVRESPQFGSLLEEAKHEIIAVGPCLPYITSHCRNSVFARARAHVKCRFLMSGSDGYEWLKDYGSGNPNRTGEYELVLERFRDWLRQAAEENLDIDVRVAPLVPTSMNFVDGTEEHGQMLLIPLPYQTDGPERPCFMIEKHVNRTVFERYYSGTLALWDKAKRLADIPLKDSE